MKTAIIIVLAAIILAGIAYGVYIGWQFTFRG